ncbi:outer membrane lipoprotein carrier protein LolA [Cohnella ginsengisoli]|uniref:Outer membrane lipoprotein carrier protein LolA n=1 Tax=Cohnella ginsengisoli TaxID=425004 RepID=A0A9X4KHQ5_9BACL|nr:outer membrane lipoprotein carrier protein LolA [Cohnella ginsengisoli]MDG0791754.1 outer membrane lipoprotein carrier protein LolA [Cohnella ginsengisoli]
MLRKLPWIAAALVLVATLLSGCGAGKNADSVVKDLTKLSDKMDSYQGSGVMTLHTGQQPQAYKVEVWYQKPNYYRVALTSASRDVTQIVLRNDDGVFVLTPSLNKSYRFQSDWPDNQGQVYLLQTLLHSIAVDNSRQFAAEKDSYVFNVMAGNYQNGSFARQKIWLDKSDYSPQLVEVTDTNSNVLVDVKFDSFEFGKKFDKSAFDMQQNLATPKGGASTTGAVPDGASPDASGKDGTAADPATVDPAVGTDGKAAEPVVEMAAIEPDPLLLPQGVTQVEAPFDVQLGDGEQGVMLRYSGTYDFSIIESQSKDRAVSTLAQTKALDLGFTVGFLTEDDTQSLSWTYDGVDYRLTTVDLPHEEMVRVAQALVDQSGK